MKILQELFPAPWVPLCPSHILSQPSHLEALEGMSFVLPSQDRVEGELVFESLM